MGNPILSMKNGFRCLKRTVHIFMTKGRCLPTCDMTLLGKEDRRYELLFEKARQQFVSIAEPFHSECKWSIGRIYNSCFESIDAEFYYCIIRTFCPKLIIEVGAGNSTYFALSAMKKNGGGSIITIDPEPRLELPSQVRQRQAKVEDVDIEIFNALDKNDILFIDSSHTKEEAEYHRKILGSLKPGVIIHHHDITYPYLPCYEEEQIILDFYLQNQETFEIISSMAYLRFLNPSILENLIPSFKWNRKRGGGSLWARKK